MQKNNYQAPISVSEMQTFAYLYKKKTLTLLYTARHRYIYITKLTLSCLH